MKHLLLILFLSTPLFTFSQECDCESNFNWIRTTFEENDAGFTFALKTKGENVYQLHNEEFNSKIKNISTDWDCAQALNEWLAFFRSGHISLKRIKKEQNQNKTVSIDRYKNWEKLDVDVEQFIEYVKTKETIDYEGVWQLRSTKIGIKKVEDNYIGFLIETSATNWETGQVKLKIHADNSVTYYMNDRSFKKFKSAELVGGVFLEMSYMRYNRVSTEIESNPEVEKYIKSMNARKPYFEKINSTTNLLRIPTFYGHDAKLAIDSVVLANKESIIKTPNLILDIRNNGGGSDRSYKELLPLLYTNPFRLVGVEFLSTPLNNQRMLDFISDPKYGFDEEEKKWAQESYDILSKREGEFVNLDSTIVNVDVRDTIYANPVNIAILINQDNGSSAEQFLLAAKQSKKVKLFGTSTTGVLDVSNMHFVKSPCENYELGYCLTRSLRIPEMAIDNHGIQPDYYLDKSILKYKWIEFVTKVLNE